MVTSALRHSSSQDACRVLWPERRVRRDSRLCQVASMHYIHMVGGREPSTRPARWRCGRPGKAWRVRATLSAVAALSAARPAMRTALMGAPGRALYGDRGNDDAPHACDLRTMVRCHILAQPTRPMRTGRSLRRVAQDPAPARSVRHWSMWSSLVRHAWRDRARRARLSPAAIYPAARRRAARSLP